MAEPTEIPFKNADASKITFPGETPKPAAGGPAGAPPAIPAGGEPPKPAEGAPGAPAGGGSPPAPAGGEPPKPGAGAPAEPPKPGAEAPNPADGGEPPKPGADAPIELTEPEFMGILNQNTGLKLKNIAEIKGMSAQIKTLTEQLAKKGELEFPNPAAKALYDFAVKIAGGEMKAAQSYLRAQSIDIKTASDKDKQFVSFLLSKPHLSEEKAREVFTALYEKKYVDGWESDSILAYEHGEATREAESVIQKAQGDFKVPETGGKNPAGAPDPEKVRAVTEGIDTTLADFDGIVISFDDTAEGAMDVAMQPDEVADFKQVLLNPESFIDALINECRDEQGNVNYQQYASEMYEILNRKRIIGEAQKNGVERGKLFILNEAKNKPPVPGSSGDGGGAPAGGGNPVPAKKSFNEAFVDAVQGAQKR